MLLFLLCAGCILYVLAGYPVALGFLARRRHRPVKKGSELPTVSVIIPVHNGGRFVAEKLESVFALDYPRELLEVIVVADGCTDETEAVVRRIPAGQLRLISIPRSGKAAALNAGVSCASGRILLMTDVRQQLQRESLRTMAACFEDPEVGVVSGVVVFRDGTCQDQADIRLYWRYESWIREKLSEIDSMFGATGPFYAIRRSLFVPLPDDILLDDVYLPMMAFLRGYRLIVEPAARATDYPMTSAREFARKVRTLGGNYQLMLRLPVLLTLPQPPFMALSFLQARAPVIALAAGPAPGDQFPVPESVERNSSLHADLVLSSGGARSQGPAAHFPEANLVPKPYVRHADGGNHPRASGFVCSGSHSVESD